MTESIASMVRGDHACLVYASAGEREDATVRFVRAGLAAREKVVYIADADREDGLARRLAAEGVDAEAAIGSGQLELRTAAEAYLAGGSFVPDEMLDLLRADVAGARDGGYAGFRVTGDMSWAARDAGCCDALLDYEARVDGVLRAAGATALCQYAAAHFDDRVLGHAATVHPLVLAARPGGACALLVERAPGGALALRGELDSFGTRSLEASLAAAAERGLELRLDLRELSFVDARGVCALAEASARLRAGGGRLVLVSARPAVRRVAALTGLDALLEHEERAA